jgi:16S rRNA (guanine527-N7)-methyltransferase
MSVPHEFLEGCKQIGLQPSVLQLQQLEAYVSLLRQWQKTYNLISSSTLDEIWVRHILDCAQLVPHIKSHVKVLDVGSGAGLPAVVLAILSDAEVTACERLGKRVQFLRHVSREVDLKEKLLVVQSDALKLSGHYDVITARAVADLSMLFDLSLHLAHEDTQWLLLKGQDYKNEIHALPSEFLVTADVHRSITSTGGVVLGLKVSHETRKR